MKISSFGSNPYQARAYSTTQKENTNQPQGKNPVVNENANQVQEKTSIAESRPLTREEKSENFKNYILNKYKDYGLTFSSGLTSPRRGVGPSISVDPRLIEQAANDPEKAKEVDEMLHAATMIDTNFFNAMNHPPEVMVSMSTHINADGSSVGMLQREYNSLEARNKYNGFNANAFLDGQEELLKKNPSSFDYDEAVGNDKIDERRAEKKRLQERIDDKKRMADLYDEKNAEKQLLHELQQRRFFDVKI